MTRRSDKELKPRNGHTLVVGIIARISGCVGQREMSLDDQVDHAKEVVAELNSGPVEYRIIATIGKGEASIGRNSHKSKMPSPAASLIWPFRRTSDDWSVGPRRQSFGGLPWTTAPVA